jgi:hypothetical protein
MHYESPRSPAGKHWTDGSLITYQNVNEYLAESDAFQRAAYANMIQKYKDYKKNQTVQLISSFDNRYNMKRRFRQDDQLNRLSESTYATVAKYHRFIGHENNPKNIKPCAIHQRRTKIYDERHTRELLKLPNMTKARSVPSFFTKRTILPSIQSASEAITSELESESWHTFS